MLVYLVGRLSISSDTCLVFGCLSSLGCFYDVNVHAGGRRTGGRAADERTGGRRAGRRAAEHVFMFGEQCSGAALQEKPKKDGRMENIFIVELA